MASMTVFPHILGSMKNAGTVSAAIAPRTIKSAEREPFGSFMSSLIYFTKRKPRSTTDGIFSNGAGIDMVWQGIYLAIVEIAAYIIGYMIEIGSFKGFFSGTECANAMAMAFLCVNFSEMFCAINMRSRTGSLFSKDMLKNINWWLFGAAVVTTLLTLGAIYIPGLNGVFGIENDTFSPEELLISFLLAVSTIPVFELGKAIRRAVNKKKDI